MEKMLKEYLDNKGAFSGELPPYVHELTNAVTGELPYKMKLTIAMSEIVLFSSQFARHIKLEDETLVPVNAISFVLASSGFSKDRTANTLRKCFADGYKVIDDRRKDLAIEKAIGMASATGKYEDPSDPKAWKQYYSEPRPLFVATSTEEGLVSHLNDLERDKIGAGYLYVGELGSELQSNANITNNIRLWSEIYDLGNKEVKVLKSKEGQSSEIKKVGVNGLFIGSHENILYDDSVKTKFKMEFSTKLARRSFFNFNPDEVQARSYASVPEMLKQEKEEEKAAHAYSIKLNSEAVNVAQFNMGIALRQPIRESEDAHDLFIAYKRYNEEVSESMSKLFPISKLVRKHAQWRALKLAGAFAIYEKHSTIEARDFIHAMSFIELLDSDMRSFEDEFRKEAYEQFVDYMHFIAQEGKADISIHKLRKMGYIPTSGNSDPRIKELVKLASSYDKSGVYTIDDNAVNYEEIVNTDILGISFLPVTGTKEQRAKSCASGYEYTKVEFNQLQELLALDMAYSPFEFQDGVRGKDNVVGGTKVLVLDIDKSTITDEECHFLLQDLNHHIARTSDPDNAFKFRIILELDAVTDVKDILWKEFMRSVSSSLALEADPLPKSQIFFSYADRNVLSVTDKHPLATKEHILMAYSSEKADKQDPTQLPKKQQDALLNNPLDTFFYAFEAQNGEGSRSLIRAAYHARDLGATTEQIIDLMHEINDYWVVPLDATRLENTIISQVRRF